jgi:cyclic-di-GMP-binding protein
MTKPELTLPDMQTPSGPVETRAKEVQQWLSSLPLADSLATSQQLFHTLHALNRMPLEAKVRLEIMELYHRPVSAVTSSLQNAFAQVFLPLSAKKRQLAVFLRQLQMEMAYGYKFVVRDMLSSNVLWSRKAALPLVIERAIQYLGEVLLRSYHVYMPCPPGVWREIHALYRYAEEQGLHNELVVGSREDAAEKVTINRSYLQAVLLGLCGPYQLPQNECIQVYGFLANWAEKAAVSSDLAIDSPVGCFLIDFTADLPAMLFPRDIVLKPAPYLRVLSAVELARIAHEDINRLQKGESPQSLRMGVECIDSACLEMLRRMIRFWGMAARRQFSRRTTRARFLSVCTGVNALHFFSDGQRAFSPPDETVPALPSYEQETLFPSNVSVPVSGADDGVALIDLDALIAEPEPAFVTEANAFIAQEVFRISRWKIRDESAGGLSLVWDKSALTRVRVGDLLGLLDEDTNQWRAAVARWLKSEDVTHVEVGVEMLAPGVKPVAVQAIPEGGKVPARAIQALILPAVAALHQPATLLAPPGFCQTGNDIYVLTGDEKPRRVRVMRILERSGAFEQILFADSTR